MNVLALRQPALRIRQCGAAACRHAWGTAGLKVRVFAGLGALPLFDPDLELDLPPTVDADHAAIAAADALLISSPEYAHGVTGTTKNALDWLVSFEPFVAKPVAVLNASPRAHHADAASRETLRTMSAIIVEDASMALPLLGVEHDRWHGGRSRDRRPTAGHWTLCLPSSCCASKKTAPPFCCVMRKSR